LVENKNKTPTFWVEIKNFSQNFVFALKKIVAWIRIRIGKKIPGSCFVKNESGSETLVGKLSL